MVTIAGCAGVGSPDAGGRDTATGAGNYGLPVHHEELRRRRDLHSGPARVVTLNQTAAENLIHLRAGDRIVGSGYEIDKTPDEIAEQY
jgi:iron complex transport system substrate-binding protein